MADSQRKVTVVIETIVKGTGANQIRGMSAKIAEVGKTAKNSGMMFDAFHQKIADTKKAADAAKLQKFDKVMKGIGHWAMRGVQAFQGVAHWARRMRMEFLGVMFLGMMIQKTFTGLVQPALQMTGAMQLLSTVLGIMFLPLGMALIEFAVGLLEWWGNLDGETKMLINRFVLFAIAAGTILMVVGQLALGLASLLFLFVGLVLPVYLLITALNEAGLIPDTWVKKWEAVKTKIGELWQKFLNWAPVKKALESLGIDIEALGTTPIQYVLDQLGLMWAAFKDETITPAIDTVTGAIDTLGNKVAEKYKDVKKFIDKILEIPATLLLGVIGAFTGGVAGMVAGAGVGAVIDYKRMEKASEDMKGAVAGMDQSLQHYRDATTPQRVLAGKFDESGRLLDEWKWVIQHPEWPKLDEFVNVEHKGFYEDFIRQQTRENFVPPVMNVNIQMPDGSNTAIPDYAIQYEIPVATQGGGGQ